MLSLKELAAGGYPVPPFLDPSVTLPDEWKETKPALEPAKRKRLIAVDCEMVLTKSGSALARVSLIDEGNRKRNRPQIMTHSRFPGMVCRGASVIR